MPYVTAGDGAEIFYKDWGDGPARRAEPRLAAELRQLGSAACCSWPRTGSG